VSSLLLGVAIKHLPKNEKADLMSAYLISLPFTYRGTAIYAMPIFPSALDKLDRLYPSCEEHVHPGARLATSRVPTFAKINPKPAGSKKNVPAYFSTLP
jgi:hypothetical protein